MTYIEQIFAILEESTRGMTLPMVNLIVNDFGRKPFLVLTACLLSLRSRDTITYPVAKHLFTIAQTPEDMLKVSAEKLNELIYKINYHRKKVHLLHAVSRYLVDNYKGEVPNTLEQLLAIPGVGYKTAALVLGEAFDIPAICVDTHVHRISNRLGLVETKTPQETENALKKIIPQDRWIDVNRYFVMWGQNICVPISPLCTKCALATVCPRIGVTKHR